ncbi:MAG: pyridoxal-phosphate dependent enzyme [Paraglaciecola sp.]|uniref:1-aminocyclopropane-1-carboxylate deaminase/D-cysteine desulfhydrase n=1 Tax=Paraglaciecola sp. TaxID=1920173 RepID=UPI0032994F6A
MFLSNQLNINTPSPEHSLKAAWLEKKALTLTLKRDDLIHPVISGNKWRKLIYALKDAKQNQVQHIISFGGGFSNHLHALGYCCHQLNIKFTAIVRGDYSLNLSPMLNDLLNWQTDVKYVNRITYKKRGDPTYLQQLKEEYPKSLIIPEGGSQLQALKGVAEIITELQQNYDYIVAPVASGGTLAGLIASAAAITPKTQVIGVGVLKGKGYLEELVSSFLPSGVVCNNWQINHDYHFGGYGKTTPELNTFCNDFLSHHSIRVEPVYSGKLCFAVKDLIHNDYFPKSSKILALHTGGLQGAR